MCINNNSVINNNYGRLQDLILLFKIFIVPQNDFFEIHRQFGHTLSKRFASPGVPTAKREDISHVSGIKKEDILATNYNLLLFICPVS